MLWSSVSSWQRVVGMGFHREWKKATPRFFYWFRCAFWITFLKSTKIQRYHHAPKSTKKSIYWTISTFHPVHHFPEVKLEKKTFLPMNFFCIVHSFRINWCHINLKVPIFIPTFYISVTNVPIKSKFSDSVIKWYIKNILLMTVFWIVSYFSEHKT